MQVWLANPRGFCAGAERAIEIAECALAEHGPPVQKVHGEVATLRVADPELLAYVTRNRQAAAEELAARRQWVVGSARGSNATRLREVIAAAPEQRYRVMQRFYRLDDGLIDRFYADRVGYGDRVQLPTGRTPVPVAAHAYALLAVALFAASFAAMEPSAVLAHRYLMHGPLWCLQRSHHEPRGGRFVPNDLLFLPFALPSVLPVHAAATGRPWLLPVALATAAYGAVYVVFHDGLVRRRLPQPPPQPAGRYLRRIVRAHRLHHAVHTRRGALSFGFLFAPGPRALRRELRHRRAAERGCRA